MNTLREAAQQALVKLEELRVTIDSEWGLCRELDQIEIDGDQWQEVIDLRAALAEQPTQDCLWARNGHAPCPHVQQTEQRPQNCGTGFCSCIECPYEQPVAWMYDTIALDGSVLRDWVSREHPQQSALEDERPHNFRPLYPRREPLTDEQIAEIKDGYSNEYGLEDKYARDFARAVERANGITGE